MIEKLRQHRDSEYLKWVREQPSVISGKTGCVAHHPIGQRFSQQKCSDYLAIPLTDAEHKKLHESWPDWEAKHGSQWMFAARTMLRAIDDEFEFPRHVVKATKRTVHRGTALTSSKIVPRPYA